MCVFVLCWDGVKGTGGGAGLCIKTIDLQALRPYLSNSLRHANNVRSFYAMWHV